jgi:hypothetical protein
MVVQGIMKEDINGTGTVISADELCSDVVRPTTRAMAWPALRKRDVHTA